MALLKHFDLASTEALQASEQLRSKFLVDFQEDVLEIRHRNSVRLDFKLVETLIESLEEASKVC